MRTKTEFCIECGETAKDGRYCNKCRHKKRKEYFSLRYKEKGGYSYFRTIRKKKINPLKESIRERANDSCEKCGWNLYYDVLQAHHIDRDRENNCSENLLLLCPTCHQVEHYLECTAIYTNRGKYQDGNPEPSLKRKV
jgi:hypothetical protein